MTRNAPELKNVNLRTCPLQALVLVTPVTHSMPLCSLHYASANMSCKWTIELHVSVDYFIACIMWASDIELPWRKCIYGLRSDSDLHCVKPHCVNYTSICWRVTW